MSHSLSLAAQTPPQVWLGSFYVAIAPPLASKHLGPAGSWQALLSTSTCCGLSAALQDALLLEKKKSIYSFIPQGWKQLF